MKIVGVIPARYGSTRFPGKPLALIGGRPLLQWVVEGALESQRVTEILLATDHAGIADLGKRLGIRVVMTPSDLPTGSDRVHKAVSEIPCDLVINIQGDEPLLRGELLDTLVDPLLQNPSLDMATLATRPSDRDLANPHTAKIVLNQRNEAIYFSRFPIPFSRIDATDNQTVCWKHIGIYVFKKAFLADFCSQLPTPLELSEGLEQLRALYLGARIGVSIVEHASIGVDTPQDVNRVEVLLKEQGRL